MLSRKQKAWGLLWMNSLLSTSTYPTLVFGVSRLQYLCFLINPLWRNHHLPLLYFVFIMSFFENAYDFDIYGGRFYDIEGGRNNTNHNDSTRISRRGDETHISHNLSHQDSRTYSMSLRLSIRFNIQSYPDQLAELFTNNRVSIDPICSHCPLLLRRNNIY